MPTKTPSETAAKNPPRPAKKAPSLARTATSNRHRPESAKSPRGGTPGGPAPAPDLPGPARGRRTTINLYECDLELLQPLRAYLQAASGLRVVRDSTLLQTLCRVYKPGPAHVAALEVVLALDGRH